MLSLAPPRVADSLASVPAGTGSRPSASAGLGLSVRERVGGWLDACSGLPAVLTRLVLRYALEDQLAVGLRNGNVSLWTRFDAPKVQRCVAVLQDEAKARTSALALVPATNLLLTTSNRAHVALWDATTRQAVARLNGHALWVYAAAPLLVAALAPAPAAPDAAGPEAQRLCVATGSRDQSIRLWDVTEVARQWAAHPCNPLSDAYDPATAGTPAPPARPVTPPMASAAAVGAAGPAAAASASPTASAARAFGTPISRGGGGPLSGAAAANACRDVVSNAHGDTVYALCALPMWPPAAAKRSKAPAPATAEAPAPSAAAASGAAVGSARFSGGLVSAGMDGAVMVWDRALRFVSAANAHASTVFAVAVLPVTLPGAAGPRVAVACASGDATVSVYLLDEATGQLTSGGAAASAAAVAALAPAAPSAPAVAAPAAAPAAAAAVAPAAGGVAPVRGGPPSRQGLDEAWRVLTGFGGSVYACVALPPQRDSSGAADVPRLATGDAESQVRLWNVLTGQCTRIFDANSGWVYALVSVPQHGLLLSGGVSGRVTVWSVRPDQSGRITAFEVGSAVECLALLPQSYL